MEIFGQCTRQGVKKSDKRRLKPPLDRISLDKKTRRDCVIVAYIPTARGVLQQCDMTSYVILS